MAVQRQDRVIVTIPRRDASWPTNSRNSDRASPRPFQWNWRVRSALLASILTFQCTFWLLLNDLMRPDIRSWNQHGPPRKSERKLSYTRIADRLRLIWRGGEAHRGDRGRHLERDLRQGADAADGQDVVVAGHEAAENKSPAQRLDQVNSPYERNFSTRTCRTAAVDLYAWGEEVGARCSAHGEGAYTSGHTDARSSVRRLSEVKKHWFLQMTTEAESQEKRTQQA